MRILIIGTTGSGKSALSRELACIMGTLLHIELDSLFWEADWRRASESTFLARVESIIESGCWIIDGNYSTVQSLVLERATMVIWLDIHLIHILRRLLVRSLRRAITKKELFSGNRETWRGAFFSQHPVILWALKSHSNLKSRYIELFEKRSGSADEWYHFTKQAQVDDFVTKVRNEVQRRY